VTNLWRAVLGCAVACVVTACSPDTLTRSTDAGASLTMRASSSDFALAAASGGGTFGPEGCRAGDQVVTAQDDPILFQSAVDANRDGTICLGATGLYDNKGPTPGGNPRGPEGCFVGDRVVTSRDDPVLFQDAYDTNRDGTICQTSTLDFYDNKGPRTGPPRGREGCLVGDRVVTAQDDPVLFQNTYDTNRDGTICMTSSLTFYDNKGPQKGPPREREGCLTGDRVVTVQDDPILFDGSYDANGDGTICMGATGFYDNKGH
jgi:hypothetical protein